MKKRMIFGVITALVTDTEQRSLMKGIISQAKAYDIDIAVFSNIINCPNTDKELNSENKIYNLSLSPDLDAIIILSESIMDNPLAKYINAVISQRTDIPVIVAGNFSTELSVSEGIFINTDDVYDIESITNHLIDTHNITNIDLLNGPENLQVSKLREEGYKKAIQKHGFEFKKEKVFYGDFWITSGHEHAMKYINGEISIPQAVVCTNDYMAYGILEVFSENGIRVPEDITITGYEYVNQRIYYVPYLTTYQRNRCELGAEAVRAAFFKISGKIFKQLDLPGRIIPGNTCSCGIHVSDLCYETKRIKIEQMYSMLNTISQFEQKLTECRSMKDYTSVLGSHLYLIRDLSSFRLCLNENWQNISITDTNEQIVNCYTITDASENGTIKNILSSRNIASYFSDCCSPSVCYFSPVYFATHYFGYAVTSLKTEITPDPVFCNWLKTVSNALEFLRMKNDINYLRQCRYISDYSDPAAGMYNRYGFISTISSAAENYKKHNRLIMLILKTEIFSDSFRLDIQTDSPNTAASVSDSFKMLILNKNEFCGKLSDNTYIFAGFNKYPDNYPEILEDKISTIMLNIPSYINEHGTNSFAVCCNFFECNNFSFNDAIADMTVKINKIIKEKSMFLEFPHYNDFQRLRNQVYSEPSAQKNSDEICQQLCLSVGYFRNMYKKYFNISFHQDCIKSRICHAKFLLFTTTASINTISSKCGYEDEKYFMRLFQQNTSYTPNRYRMMFQNMENSLIMKEQKNL